MTFTIGLVYLTLKEVSNKGHNRNHFTLIAKPSIKSNIVDMLVYNWARNFKIQYNHFSYTEIVYLRCRKQYPNYRLNM